jgi:hypothetical protein
MRDAFGTLIRRRSCPRTWRWSRSPSCRISGTAGKWSDHAIARTTPGLLALFSLVTLLATRLVRAGTLPPRSTTWYQKSTPTVSDALAAVRAEFWRQQSFHRSTMRTEIPKPARQLLTRLTTILREAA